MREIKVTVRDGEVRKNNNCAGVQGEGNVTDLVINFREDWDGMAKKVTLWDAKGENPVERTLTADLLVDLANDTRTYRVPIPPEPLVHAGLCSFVIDGYADGERARTASDTLEVKAARKATSDTADPTPTQAEQLQLQIDTLLGDLSAQAAIAQDGADTATEQAQAAGVSAASAEADRIRAEAAADAAETSEERAASDAQTATAQAQRAETARSGADTAQAGAEAAREAAVTAKTGSQTARTGAETAREGAEAARDAAVVARTRAEAAQMAADLAKSQAGASATAAASSAAGAGASASAAAGSAQGAAESAEGAAEHESNALDALLAANAARDAAVAAQAGAEDAEEGAMSARDNAGISAAAASNSAASAGASATAAAGSAQNAATKAQIATEQAVAVAEDRAAVEADAAAAQEAAESAHVYADIAYGEADRAKREADRAAEIVGGDFATKTEAQAYASTAEQNAKNASRPVDWMPTAEDVGAAQKGESFSVTLTVAGWSDNTQTVTHAKLLTGDYAYTVCPAGSSFTPYGQAMIYADDITTNGQVTFHCVEPPAQSVQVNILRLEANEA